MRARLASVRAGESEDMAVFFMIQRALTYGGRLGEGENTVGSGQGSGSTEKHGNGSMGEDS